MPYHSSKKRGKKKKPMKGKKKKSRGLTAKQKKLPKADRGDQSVTVPKKTS